ncbi:MAG: phenylalanine--tRNA ligase beta subunit-related protein [Anaerolineales bacterium]
MNPPEYFRVSARWRDAYPDARVGVLVLLGAANPSFHPGLESRRVELEEQIRGRFTTMDRAALLTQPPLAAYHAYYRRFGQTYHVQLQLESILLKGKHIPSGLALVQAMFMAELDTLHLTAGHDLDSIRLPLTLDVAGGAETYTLLRGTPHTTKSGDMMISDQDGVVSSIVYGPDERTQIRPETRNAVFTTYAPPGISRDSVQEHLERLRQLVLLFAPEARAAHQQVYGD